MGLPGADVFERVGLRAWPGIDVEWDGAWVRRAANGYTHRANSVQSLDASDDGDAEARIAASRAWFEARDLQPVFRITPLAGRRIRETLDEQGWASVEASCLFAMELGEFEPDPRAIIYEPLDPRFLSAQQQLQNYSDERQEKFKALISAVDIPACGVVLYSPEGEPVASSFMDVAEAIVITGNVVTDESQRRKGYGAAMMRTGLAWARNQGAKIAALNVAAHNDAAQALYKGLGYAYQYDYIYRIPGAAA